MKKKQILNTVLSLGTAVAMVAGGGMSVLAETASDEEVTLTFWTPTWRKDAESQIIEDFMAENPNITIEPTYYSTDDIRPIQRLQHPLIHFQICGITGADIIMQNITQERGFAMILHSMRRKTTGMRNLLEAH